MIHLRKLNIYIFFLLAFFLCWFILSSAVVSTETSQCPWVFDHYQSSAIELEYLNKIESDQEGEIVCNGNPSQDILTLNLETLRLNAQSSFNVSTEDLFSKMHYRSSCDRNVSIFSLSSFILVMAIN